MLTITVCVCFVFLILGVTAIIETILDKIQLKDDRKYLERYNDIEEGE